MGRGYRFLIIGLLLLLVTSACNRGSAPVKGGNGADPDQAEIDRAQEKIKERADKATKSLARQKELKEKVTQIADIEKFTRETKESEVIDKLGEPSQVRDVNLNNTDTKVLYYRDNRFAVWFWQNSEDDNKKPEYQYRATISLNHGRFDIPLHNVLTEDELKDLRKVIEASSIGE